MWLELRASRLRFGDRPAVLGIVSDITERRRIETELRDSRDLVRAVEDSVLDQMAVLDSQGRVIAVNAVWREFALNHPGHSSTDEGMIAGLSVGDNYLLAWESVTGEGTFNAQDAARGIRAVVEGQSDRYSMQYPSHLPGASLWFEMNVTPLRGTAGGAVVVHTDITERKRIARALQDSERLYRSMVSALSEGVITFDLRAHVLACNPAPSVYSA